MSTAAGSTSQSTGKPLSSSYDMGFGDSDVESSGFGSSLMDDIPRDYWFGRKYFECVMAQYSMQRSPHLFEDVAIIESRFEALLQKFPYDDALQRLQPYEPDRCVVDDGDDRWVIYRAVMSSIGAMIRTGGRDKRAKLVALLRQCAASLDSTSGRDGSKIPVAVSIATSGNGDYAMALKEYGDKQGFTPEYAVDCVTKVPPVFKATLIIDEQKFVGMGRQKKIARHEAARKACSHLGISI